MRYKIGIDLGGTDIKIGIIDEACAIVGKHSIPTRARQPYQGIVADMAKGMVQALDAAGISVSECVSVGIGSPGACDSRRGIVVFAGNLSFVNVPIVAELGRHIALPVFLSNDANCAAYGEAICGAAKGTKNSVLLTLGTGIGGGIIIDGKIYSGAHGASAEIGHMVMMPGGEPCTCGERGCFEAYASATALIRQARYAALRYPKSAINTMVDDDLNRIGGETVFAAAAKGDAAARKVLDDYLWYLSIGIVSIVNIFRPDVVLIGGGVSNAGDALIAPVNEYVAHHSFASRYVAAPPVKLAALGNDAGIIGAALLKDGGCM